MTPHSSILTWKIPWAEEPGRLQSIGLQRVGHHLITEHTYTYTYYNITSKTYLPKRINIYYSFSLLETVCLGDSDLGLLRDCSQGVGQGFSHLKA